MDPQRLIAVVLLVFAGTSAVCSAESAVLQVFDSHCVKCHGKDGKTKGKVNLLNLKSDSDLVDDVDLLQDIIEVIDNGDMPPEDEPGLKPDIRESAVAELRGLLGLGLAKRATFPKTPIRRMNRFQYNNAVKDLFKLNVEVFSLPEKMMRSYGYFNPASGKMPDTVHVGSRPLGKSQMIEPRLAGVGPFPQDLRAEHGFDNRGDHLSMSPIQMEAFYKLSQSIVSSNDFTPKRCGIWGEFFAEPQAKGDELDRVVHERLASFLRRAFRRPVAPELVSRYAANVKSQLKDGVPFERSMKNIASAVLCSPRFLYLYDQPIKGVRDDFNLASRLSFFL